jgi:gamma-glutamyltranspeptidase/glutathione hydrolase
MMGRVRLVVLAIVISSGPASAGPQDAGSAAKPSSPGATAGGRGPWQGAGREGAVTAGGMAAVEAGLEVLKAGGNATDAAVATILALSVTDATSFCFGGEVPMLVYDARTRDVTVIAGQGAAPRLATREYFAARGGIPARGIEAAAVPAALDACLTALDRFGTMTFRQVVGPTLKLLDGGARPWHADLARTLRTLVAAEERAGAADRSRGLRLVADEFYRGPIARRIDAWSRASGGLIREVDLATHVTRVEEPLVAEYRGRSVYKCGAWTQGPCLLEALQVLQGFDLGPLGHDDPKAVHLTVEAMKLGFADRDTYYADPLFAPVPIRELLDPGYAAKRRTLVDPGRASLSRRPGDPRAGKAVLDPAADPAERRDRGPATAARDTTTCVVVDRWGNMVAATPSGWSGVVAGDTGVWLGSRLQSFNLWPGHPNVIEPGKRPRITLTPTIVLEAGKPVLGVSVAGGDNQDQMTLQLLVNHLDFRLEPAASVVAPRFMSEHFIGSFLQKPLAPGRLRVNPEYGASMLDALRAMGHDVIPGTGPLSAAPSVIAVDPRTGSIRAAGDPRAGRHALAY